MMRKRWTFVLPLVLTLALTACGKKDESDIGPVSDAAPKAAAVHADLRALVPTDAIAIVYVKAPGNLEGKVKSFLARIDPEVAAGVNIAQVLSDPLEGGEDQWDPDKPMALAISLGEGDPERALSRGQGISLIVGMRDAAAGVAAIEKAYREKMAKRPEEFRDKPSRRPHFQVAGNFVKMTMGPPTSNGGSDLARRAPDADVALRIDLAALVTKFRPQIDAALADMDSKMAGADMPPEAEGFRGMFEGFATFAKDFVNSAETLEIGATIEGTTVDLGFGFTAKAGSKLDKPDHDHSGLAEMAKHLPDGWPVHMLLSMDWGNLMEWMKPLFSAMSEAMPDDMKQAWTDYMNEVTEMTALIGPNYAMSIDVGDKGIQAVQVADAKDAATYMQRMEKLFGSDLFKKLPGISVAKSGATKISGIDVTTYEMSFDLKELMKMQGQDVPPEATQMMDSVMSRLFGGNSIKWHMAVVENKLLYAMGEQAQLEALIESVRKGGGKAPAALQGAIDKAGGKPTFILQMEIRTLVRQVVAIVQEFMDDPDIPSVPIGPSIPLTIWGKHDGRVYGGGLSVEVGGIVDLIQSMKK